jgi:CRP/FNR family transcriptional regulator, cyclic AMP receptor protein
MDVNRIVIDTLRRVPLFNDLSAEQIAAIATRVSRERRSAGQVVFSEGDKGGDLLILQEGSVRIVKTAASGRQQLISIEREGSSLGEVSVFD